MPLAALGVADLRGERDEVLAATCTPRLPSRRSARAGRRRWRARRRARGGSAGSSARKYAASVASLQFGTSSRAGATRASRAVSTTARLGQGRPCLPQARAQETDVVRRVVRDQDAATRRTPGTTAARRPSGGAVATSASVMPVSAATNGGIGTPGLTSVWNSPRTSPPRTLTAPISVMPASAGAPPVVSRSTTTNVTSDSGVPRSSNAAWCGASTIDTSSTLDHARRHHRGPTRAR